MTKVLLSLLCLVFLPPGIGVAKEYRLSEIGVSLLLSNEWTQADASVVESKNSEMRRLRPASRIRALAAFAFNASPSEPFDSSSVYMWIMATPMPNPPVTAEQLVASLPKAVSKDKANFERMLGGSVESEGAHYDESLKAVVWRVNQKEPNGTICPMKCYLLPKPKFLISINVYATEATSELIFSMVQGIVWRLTLAEDEQMPREWMEKLKTLFKD